jgi:CRP-like cAMP-binding protein
MNFSSFFNYPTEEEQPRTTEQLLFLPNRSRHDWGKLLAHTQTYRFSKGDYVLGQGETERAFYLVTFGQFEEVMPTEGGTQQRIGILESGSVIGEQSFLDGQPQPSDVRALTDGEIARLNLESFEVLAAREAELARAILFDLGRIVSMRLRQQMT